jgi:hypothetical protein
MQNRFIAMVFLVPAVVATLSACHQREGRAAIQCKPVDPNLMPAVQTAKDFILASRFNGVLSHEYCVSTTANCAHCRTRGDVLIMFDPKDGGAAGAVVSPTNEHPPILQVVQD